MKTSVILTTKDNLGKTKQKSFSDINPNATSEQIVALTSAMNNVLTTNTYIQTDRVDKINCDTEASSKLTPTLTLSATSDSAANVKSAITADADGMGYSVNVTYNGDGILYVIANVGLKRTFTQVRGENGSYRFALWCLKTDMDNQLYIGEYKILATETDTYKAAEVTFTITA